MALELPVLPYAYDALGPYMSKETLEFHHDKHHLAYVTNGNNLLKDSPLAAASVEDICKVAYADKAQGLINNVGQHYNHSHFWNWMKPNGGGKKIPAALMKAIDLILAAMTRCALILCKRASRNLVLVGAGSPSMMANCTLQKP